MAHERSSRAARIAVVTGIGFVLFAAAAASGQTQLSLQETGLTVTADHSGNQVVNLHLNSLGPNAAVYGIVGRANGPQAHAKAGAVKRIFPAPAIVQPAGVADWSAPHTPDELIVCYDKQMVGGIRQANPSPAMRRQKNDLHARLGTTLRKELALINADVIKATPGADLQTLAQRYAQQPGVSFVQPNYVYTAIALPNDPNFPFVPSTVGPPNDLLLWGLHTTAQNGTPKPSDVTFDADIDAAEAWEVTTGSSAAVVAVIDTGVNYTHPDIVANMWTNPGEINANGLDDDGNGYIDDYYGYDFANNDGNPMDDHYHGTHVAGTIGAVGGNAVNIAGVNWNVRIMALKFLGADGRGFSADAAEAVAYAVLMGAAFSNNSWGGGAFDAALYAAISNAGSAGHLFLAAAGNNSTNTDNANFYPSTYNLDNIISVAALDRNEHLADFSNYGATTVDLAAPGVGIYSLQLGGGIFPLDGTSMATPHVSGVAALLKAVRPDAGPLQIKQWILDGVTPNSNLAGKVLTGGRLNAVEPLRLATMPWLHVGNREGILNAGASLTIPVTFVTENVPVGTYSGSLIVLDLSYDTAVTPRIEIPVTMDLQFVELPPIVEDVDQFVVRNVNSTVTLVGSDRNIGQSVSFTITSLPTLGTLLDPATGQPIATAPHALPGGANTVTYAPAPNQLYSTSFQYTATDGTMTSNTGTITLDVIQPPQAPEDVSAYSGAIFVELNWLPNIETNLAGYHVYVSPTAGGPYLRVTQAPYAGTTFRHYPSSALAYYVVTAVLDFGAESAYSAEVSGQPTLPPAQYTPHNLRGTAAYSKVYLEWEPPQIFNGTYRIIRTPHGGNAEIIAELTGKYELSYIDTDEVQQYGGGPVNGVTYDYYVENYDYWDLWGSEGNLITVTPDDYTPPAAPTGVQAIGGPNYVDVRWDANSELDIDQYWVLRSTTSGSNYYFSGIVSDRRFYDLDVESNTTYYYVIVALDLDGEESDFSAEVTAATGEDSTPPAAPTNLTATSGDGFVTLDWADNTEPDLAVYVWYRATTSGGPYEQLDNDTPSYFQDHGVVNGTTYYYVVTALDLAGNESPFSNEASATPQAPGGCTQHAQCADGVYCNGVEVCVAGQCQAGTPVNCGDGIACTADSCNEATDSCDHVTNNAACNDGLYCNGVETCDAQLGCRPGTPVGCNDNVGCTNDACNEATDACDHVPANANCDDGVFCNGAEVCHAALGCQAGADPCDPLLCRESDDQCVECLDASDCTDGLFCNGAEVCDAAGDCQAGSNPCPGQTCNESTDACVAMAEVWLSFIDSASVPGVGTIENEDIVARNVSTGTWSLIFDGSDVGLAAFTIDGFARLSDGSLLLSFAEAGNITGMTGGPSGTTLDDSDIVRFIPTTLGATTAGSFAFYFDGSDVGLTTDNEDIDAIALTPTGQLVVSTLGGVTANGVSGADSDLLLFSATSLGSVTAGTFSFYVDGSDVGLSDNGNEDVDAAAIRANGVILLSTLGNFSVAGASGGDEDILQFTPTQLGSTTSGAFAMYLDLSALGIAASEDVGAVEYRE